MYTETHSLGDERAILEDQALPSPTLGEVLVTISDGMETDLSVVCATPTEIRLMHIAANNLNARENEELYSLRLAKEKDKGVAVGMGWVEVEVAGTWNTGERGKPHYRKDGTLSEPRHHSTRALWTEVNRLLRELPEEQLTYLAAIG